MDESILSAFEAYDPEGVYSELLISSNPVCIIESFEKVLTLMLIECDRDILEFFRTNTLVFNFITALHKLLYKIYFNTQYSKFNLSLQGIMRIRVSDNLGSRFYNVIFYPSLKYSYILGSFTLY